MDGASCPEIEVWLPIPDFVGHYEASNLGRIRRVSSGRILRQNPCGGSYVGVTLSFGNVQTQVRTNIVVLSAFCGPRPFPSADAAHNDGNPLNNRLTNLRWATKTENQADVERHGNRCRGEAVFGSKLSPSTVNEIRKRVKSGERNPSIARDYGVSISTVHKIRHNRTWKHLDAGVN